MSDIERPRLGRRAVLVGAAVAVPAVTAACTIGGSGGSDPAPPTSSTPPADPARVTVEPAANTEQVNPTAKVTVGIELATLGTVTVTDAAGTELAGVMDTARTGWKSTDSLAYDTEYTVNVEYETLGLPRKKTSSFHTVVPPNMTLPYFENTGGNSLIDGATYGVGQVVVVHFDEPITDRAAAQKLLTVTTTPPLDGVWSWATDATVHWRPEKYYPSGTTVAVKADVFGKEVSPGLWGQRSTEISFNIGESHVSIADDNTKQVQVFVNGNMVRSMPTSMGQGGTEVVNGTTLHFWTQSGTYTVLDKANPVIMDSSTYGLPINSRLGYKESINWATRISNDGIYLHALASTMWAQGNTNTSHGCLNLSPADAQWFYGLSRQGDVVVVRNTGGPPLEQWQNGDWSVPWSAWVAASAAPPES